MYNILVVFSGLKKFLFLTMMASSLAFTGMAQQNTPSKPFYNPKADAHADIKNAMIQAQKEHKNIMLQIGGNWCIWCTRFHNLIETNDSLHQLMNNNYVYLPVNYDQNNKNSPLWAELGYPQRFGFPVFVILNDEGKIIHTQNSAYLEDGKGHSPEKVAQFLKNWSPAAVLGKTINR